MVTKLIVEDSSPPPKKYAIQHTPDSWAVLPGEADCSIGTVQPGFQILEQ